MKRIKLLFLLILCIPASAQTQLGADIDGEAAFDQSGHSVSLSSDGTRVAIGASLNDGNGTTAGHVRIYEYSAGSWTQLGADIDGEVFFDWSGSSVSLSSDGTRVAIGAYKNDGNGTDAGHVRIYEYSAGSWTQLGVDIDGEAYAYGRSGYSVSLSSGGDTVASVAPINDGAGTAAGHVRIYTYSAGSWSQLGADIDGEAVGDQSGFSVSLSSDGSTVAIGARKNLGVKGHTRIYEYSAGSWTQLGADIDGEAASDESGFSVSLSSDGSRVAIGARNNDGNGNDAGHARIYEYGAGSWTQLGVDIDGEAAGDFSGDVSLSSDGTTVAIGAPFNDGNGTDAGHVRVYSICFDTIQQQPQSNTFYTVPGDAYFTVIHSDTTANYQWQEDTGTGWSDLSDQGVYSGTATDSLILTGITASLNGYEYRCLVDACSMDTTDLATLTVVDNIGIGEVLTDVVVSPNPTSGILNIVVNSLSEYEVFNINGQRVAQGNTEGQIDITNLPTGSYQIIITNDDGRSTHTIQKI
jgi:cytochrome c2